jgi:hypothetical protein
MPFSVGCIDPVGMRKGWITYERRPSATTSATKMNSTFSSNQRGAL